MSEHVTLLHDLDAGKNCSGEAAAAIRDLEQRIDEQREKVATWIMSLGLSTGHGDTLEDLLKEAHWQVREYQQRIAEQAGQIERDGEMIAVQKEEKDQMRFVEVGLRQRIVTLKAALQRIANPIKHMQAEAEAEGARINGAMALSIANDPEYLKGIAKDALRAAGYRQRRPSAKQAIQPGGKG